MGKPKNTVNCGVLVGSAVMWCCCCCCCCGGGGGGGCGCGPPARSVVGGGLAQLAAMLAPLGPA